MRTILLPLAVLLLLFWPVMSLAATAVEFGLRGGIDASGLEENYAAQEIYLLYDTPWKMSIGERSEFLLRLDAGAAHFEAADDDGFWLALGGDLVFRPFFLDGLEIEAGWRPTWLPDYRFGEDNFGGQVQFSSHAGVALTWKKSVWSYRFQHTSNAGLHDDNPGLDLHLFGVGFRF